jgi:hypothetical protein
MTDTASIAVPARKSRLAGLLSGFHVLAPLEISLPTELARRAAAAPVSSAPVRSASAHPTHPAGRARGTRLGPPAEWID